MKQGDSQKNQVFLVRAFLIKKIYNIKKFKWPENLQ